MKTSIALLALLALGYFGVRWAARMSAEKDRDAAMSERLDARRKLRAKIDRIREGL